jgi:5-methyltetrahydrofolate--homocysteine methyltransferase
LVAPSSGNSLRVSTAFGIWPANADGEDILLFADERRTDSGAVLHTLCQQLTRHEGTRTWRSPISLGHALGAFTVQAG